MLYIFLDTTPTGLLRTSLDLVTLVQPSFVSMFALSLIPGHVGLEGNVRADMEAKLGCTKLQPVVATDYATACSTLTKFVRGVADSRYDNDPHTRTHRRLSGSDHAYRCWQHDWSRDQCITLAQLCTGHSPLLASFLLCVSRQSSAMCPHCNVAEEMAEHLLL